MNINYNYKIYWFEDQDSWLESEKLKLEERYAETKLAFEIAAFKDGSKLNEINSETEIDILLMDYNLHGSKGNDLIVSLRENNVLCHIIFYSEDASFEESLTEKEGVYTTARRNLGGELNRCVDDICMIIENVSNMRGRFITGAVDLEEKMNGLISAFLASPQENFLRHELIEKEFFTSMAKKKVVSHIGDQLLNKINEEMVTLGEGAEKERLKGEKERLEKTRTIFGKYDDEIIHVRNTLAHSKHAENEAGNSIFINKALNKTYEITENWVRGKLTHLTKHSINLDRFRSFVSK